MTDVLSLFNNRRRKRFGIKKVDFLLYCLGPGYGRDRLSWKGLITLQDIDVRGCTTGDVGR